MTFGTLLDSLMDFESQEMLCYCEGACVNPYISGTDKRLKKVEEFPLYFVKCWEKNRCKIAVGDDKLIYVYFCLIDF